MQNNELYHYGIKGMKWGVRRRKMFSRKYAKTERKLREQLEDSGRKHTTYSREKAVKEKRSLLNKEDWREYSRNLYERDAQYKSLYDQFSNDRRLYDEFLRQNQENIHIGMNVLGF